MTPSSAARHSEADPCRSPASIASIPVWHVVISGFTQSLSRPSGAQNLWNQLRRARANADAPVLLEPWDADWSGLAELIWRFRPLDRPTQVFCYAYSYGGGWGFPNLARQLEKRGLEITHAALSDPVYRPRHRLFALAALLPTSRIVVPKNVREVSWFFQRENLPRGHQVVAADAGKTIVHAGQQIRGTTHHYMDDQAAWWMKCLQVASAARPAPLYGSLLETLARAA